MRAWVAGVAASVLVAGAGANTVLSVDLPDFNLTGPDSVVFTETLNPGFDTFGLRLQAEWANVDAAWSSEFEAVVTAPNGESFSWRPVGGENTNNAFSFDVTRYLAFPDGTPGDGDWEFSFSTNFPVGEAELDNVSVDLIEVDTYTYESETLHDGDTWFRPDGLGPDLADFGPQNYHVQEFSVLEDGLYDIYSETEGFDGVLYLYEDSFDPEDQLTNLIAFNDDGRTPLTTSDLVGLELDADREYFLVTSAYGFCEIGHLRAVIGGTGGVVPEPASLGLLALSSLMLLRRK